MEAFCGPGIVPAFMEIWNDGDDDGDDDNDEGDDDGSDG